MKPLNILEGWAYQIVERVAKKTFAEDDLVEFKSTWIEPHKAARRIAGQANAARGEDCLWLIGIDPEKLDSFVGIGTTDPAAWFGEVESYFVDKHHPEWRCFQVTYDGKNVYAIAFGTSEHPFLINLKKFNQKGGQPEGVAEAELPWRTGTRTGSATRQQILSLLYRVPPLPDIEVLGSQFLLTKIHFNPGFYVKLYVVPRSRDPVVIPVHRVQWTIQIPDGAERFFDASCEFLAENDDVARRDHVQLGRLLIPEEFEPGVRGMAPANPSDSIQARASELIIKEPGIVWFVGNLAKDWDDLYSVNKVNGKILLSVGADRTILLVNFESQNVLPSL